MIALNWKYTPPSYHIIPIGNYRARISDLVWDVSKSGKQMLVVTCKISGHSSTLKYYLLFSAENPETVNRSNFYLKKFCDAFNLNPEDMNNPAFNLNQWLNAEGGVNVIHEEKNGVSFPKIKSFLTRKQFAYLTPYVDTSAPQSSAQQPQYYPQPQPQQDYYAQSNEQNNSFDQPAMNQDGIISFN